MAPRIIVHHSCCAETAAACGPAAGGGRYLVHTDGTIVYPAPGGRGRPADPGEAIHVILLGYFNSNHRGGAIDSRQFSALMELLRRMLPPGEDLFGRLLYHHSFCPGFKFPREELEWRLWNMLS